jgi:hypothetical protein
MATKKTTTKKTRTPAASAKNPVTRKAVTRKTRPTEEDIRRKAEELYHERIARGEYGTAEDDWLKAEAILKDTGKKK